MKIHKPKILQEVYNIRASIYTLFIFSSLLFLLNLKHLQIGFDFYVLVLVVLMLTSLSEFLFSMKYTGKIYHLDHPLRKTYERTKRHHLYNIMLLPIVQYVVCGILIYHNDNSSLSLMMVVITCIMTYGTFLAYENIYAGDLAVSHSTDDFFDLSRYVSFAFITYLVLTYHAMYYWPRSFTAAIIGGFQLIYILSAIWRRKKISFLYLSLSLLSSILLSVFIYIYFLNIPLINEIGLIAFYTANIIIFDYLFTSLLVKSIQKKLNKYNFFEYVLVSLIALCILYFSR